MTAHAKPILGILVSRLSITEAGPFGIITAFCKEVMQASAARGGRAFVFTLDQIPCENHTVIGWSYKNEAWESQSYPLPVCVYNRIGSRSNEQKETTREKLAWLKEQGVLFFNDQFLNKWEIYSILCSSEIAALCPDTAKYKGAASLREFLNTHSYIYLKPNHGSLGRHIIRIYKTQKGYICEYASREGTMTQHFYTFEHMHRLLLARIKKRPFIMQKGLHLIKNGESLIDFRVLVQKNKGGAWSITSIVGRTGSPNSIISNVARGGSLLSLSNALALVHPPLPSSEGVAAAIRQRALQIARVFEHHITGHYAELGIDLGVDTSGKIWLIEINSKPSKNDESLAHVRSRPRRSVIRLVDYCFYHSGIPYQHPSRRRSN